MKFGLSIPQFEEFGDVRRLADLAEGAGKETIYRSWQIQQQKKTM